VSAYDNDARVTKVDDGFYRVTCCPGEGPVGKVGPGLYGGFVAYIDEDDVTGPGFNSADDAIRSLIGDPQ
jgi:hypothetical protein